MMMKNCFYGMVDDTKFFKALVSNHVEVIIITRRPRRCYHFTFALKFHANRHLSFNQISYAFFLGGEWGGGSSYADKYLGGFDHFPFLLDALFFCYLFLLLSPLPLYLIYRPEILYAIPYTYTILHLISWKHLENNFVQSDCCNQPD